MEQSLLTIEEVKSYFKVKDNRTIKKYIKMGLKFIPLGKKDIRFDAKDVQDFAENIKTIAQEELMIINPIKRKTKHNTVNIDFQKRKINLEMNKVV